MKKKDFSDAEIEVLLSEVHSKRQFYFQAYIVAYQVLKKKGIGSIGLLQMQLMEFHLLIEQSQK